MVKKVRTCICHAKRWPTKASLFRSLVGMCLRQIGIGCSITLERSSHSTPRIITIIPQVHSSAYFRMAQLQSSALFPSLRHLYYNLGETSMLHIFLFLSPLLDSLELYNFSEDTVFFLSFLATLSSPMLSRIVLRNGKKMSVDSAKMVGLL